jgi:hypothetical protein
LALDYPKSSTVKSKTKGKPTTIQVVSTSAVDNSLYKSTEVLETLHVGAISYNLLEVEEGGVPIQSSELQMMEIFDSQHDDSPVNPIGDLYALQAKLALLYSQPYPGDEPMSADECWQDEHFDICWWNDAEYIIFDHETNEEVILEAKYLQCSKFTLGAWYAWIRMEALGLDPNAFPQDEQFDVELGDVLVDSLCLLGREA